MRKLMTFDGRLALRSGVARHVLSATTLLLVGFLVLAFAHLGGGASGSTINRGQPVPTCSHPTSTTAAAFEFGAHPKTVTRTKTKTVTKTAYKTRTRTVCLTTTKTEPGTTTTLTTTVTVTEAGPTSVSTTTATVTEPGSTTTVTEPGPTTTTTTTTTVTKTQTTSAFTCPAADQVGFPLGASDYTGDPITCSYPAVSGEDPHDFFCTYSSSTGVLVTDSDAGFCPVAAIPKP